MKFKAQTTCIGTNKCRNFQSKIIISVRSPYLVQPPRAAMRYGMESNRFLNVCLWKRILYCLYTQPKFVFWNCRTRITSETPTNQITHVFNRRHIRRISRPWKKLHVLGRMQVSNTLWNMLACIILLQGCLERRKRLWAEALKGRTCCYWDYPQSATNIRLWYEIALQTITPGVRSLCRSITHSGRQRWPG